MKNMEFLQKIYEICYETTAILFFASSVFTFQNWNFPSNFQEGNLRIDFSCLIRTLGFEFWAVKHKYSCIQNIYINLLLCKPLP
jgi:hypothetical protein